VTRSKTPNPPIQRRQTGGARHEASERVVIRASSLETSGWTLNVSRGGIRAVVEDPLDPDKEYEVSVGSAGARRARIAWSRQEADGQIVGLRFLDVEGSMPPEEGSAS
jgi:c-di-GMP-binding flagellar brake protein YcgR